MLAYMESNSVTSMAVIDGGGLLGLEVAKAVKDIGVTLLIIISPHYNVSVDQQGQAQQTGGQDQGDRTTRALWRVHGLWARTVQTTPRASLLFSAL